MAEKNKKLGRRIVEEFWNERKPQLINELYDPDCVIHTPDGELKGREGIRELFDTYVTAFPDSRLTVEYMLAEDDKVMTAYTFTGTHKGRLMDISPTGKQVSVRGTAVCQIRNNRVVEERDLWDTLSMMEQLGAVPVHEHTWK